jgi:5-methylthioribose kinase
MKKILTDEQKRIWQIISDLKQHAWRKIIIDQLQSLKDNREKVLNWKIPEIWLDDIKYSKNSILRAEYLLLDNLINYPDKVIRDLGYSTVDETKK